MVIDTAFTAAFVAATARTHIAEGWIGTGADYDIGVYSGDLDALTEHLGRSLDRDEIKEIEAQIRAALSAAAWYAAVGTDGLRPVVWGVGRTADEAREDAREWDEDREVEVEVVAITADRAHAVLAGDVDAADLVA